MIDPSKRSPGLASYHKHREERLIRMSNWGKDNRQKRTEYAKRYRKTAEGSQAVQRAVKKYEDANPRRKAWIEAEKLPLKPCIKCGNPKTHRHHPDINKPMVIVYLCPLHHKQEHML